MITMTFEKPVLVGDIFMYSLTGQTRSLAGMKNTKQVTASKQMF